MGAPQRQVIEAIREKVGNVEERFEDYREELLAALDEILRLEQQRPHNVAQQIQTANYLARRAPCSESKG